jgi:hypothetical protein
MSLQDIFLGTAPGDKTGTPARQAGQMINANFAYLNGKIDRKDGIVTTTGLTVSGQDVTMNAFWEWIIDTVNYTNPYAVVLNFPLATAGNSRLDMIALTTSNTAIRIAGTESTSNPVSPILPDNMLQASLVLITDSSVGTPSDPITGDIYIKKIERQKVIIPNDVLSFTLNDERHFVEFTNDEQGDFRYFILGANYISGQNHPLRIRNNTGHAFTLMHLYPSGSNLPGEAVLFFPNNPDNFILQNKEIIEFVYDTDSNRFEYFGVISNGGSSSVSSATIEQLTSATVWNFNHGLNNPNPCVSVWNSLGEIIFPSKIISVDSNNLKIFFPVALSGYSTAVGGSFVPTYPVSYDTDAHLFIDAVGTLNYVNQEAIKQLVTDLKDYGLWNKLIAFYPKAGSTSFEHKWNLKDPRDLDIAYRQVYSGLWTHNSFGAKSNSTDTFSDTKLNLSTIGLAGNFSMGFYITEATSNNGDVYYMGAHTGSNNTVSIQRSLASKIITHAYSGGNALTVNSPRYFLAISVLGTNKKTFFDDQTLENVSVTGVGVPNANIYEGALNLSGRYGSLGVRFGTSFIANGLTSTEIENLRICILAYETLLGRN